MPYRYGPDVGGLSSSKPCQASSMLQVAGFSGAHSTERSCNETQAYYHTSNSLEPTGRGRYGLVVAQGPCTPQHSSSEDWVHARTSWTVADYPRVHLASYRMHADDQPDAGQASLRRVRLTSLLRSIRPSCRPVFQSWSKHHDPAVGLLRRGKWQRCGGSTR